jgi:hypothetical protein
MPASLDDEVEGWMYFGACGVFGTLLFVAFFADHLF